MAVSGVSTLSNVAIKPTTPKPTTATANNPNPPSTPAATVEFSHQAIHAATVSSTPATPTGNSPKVNTAAVANKESNEPLQLLTKQAKHGDQVAKLLLKQITKKQAAKQAATETPTATDTTKASQANDVEESSPADEKSGTAEVSGKSESSESSATTESAVTAEAGKGELVDQHA